METLTIRVHLRTKAELEREAAAHNRSRSKYIRTLLEDRHDHPDDARIDELETRIDELRGDLHHERARADELQGMLKAANRRNRETEALVAYVEQQEGVVGRAKRWLFGEDWSSLQNALQAKVFNQLRQCQAVAARRSRETVAGVVGRS